MALVGIDLGTTNSLIAVWENHKVKLLKNSLGHDMTPSVVGVDDDGTLLVGEIAKQRRVSHPDYTAAEFKRKMGTDFEYSLGDRKYLPEELSAILLKKLIADAQEQLADPITEAVISVPAYFDNNQREATKRAAQIAGIDVKRLVNEPSAAVLYKQWQKGEEKRDGIQLVVDFGGGTLDISVVDCFENIIEIVAVSGNNQLGGKDFDLCIAKDFCTKNELTYEKLRKSTRENILWTAENVKRALTENETVTMRVHIGNEQYEAVYTDEELLRVTAEVLVQMKTVLNDALRGAKVELDDIAEIILVGGSCKMPIVQKYLSALFKRPLTPESEGDYLVGYGAGVLTGIINRESEISEIVMTDVCPFSLGTGARLHAKIPSTFLSIIIPKNSILPISRTEQYSGLKPFQKQIGVTIYQGEEFLAEDNLLLGKVTVDVTPNDVGDTKIEVTFRYDINGILDVSVVDLFGKHSAEAVIVNKDSRLSPEEIENKRQALRQLNSIEKYKEEARNILAWAQRLYSQADTQYQEILRTIITDFQQLLNKNVLSALNQKKQVVLAQLLKLEMIINRDYFGNEDVISQLLEENTEDEIE